jgi:hypothetical protein
MKNQTQYSETAATSRRASSRLKLVLLGVLAPTALFALPVGTMMFVGPGGETAPVAAGAGPALDCASPRNAWRPACQATKSNPVRDADVTGSINDAPAPAGALDQKAKRRSVAGAPAIAQPDSSAVNSAPTPPAQAASPPASPMRQSIAQANPEPARKVKYAAVREVSKPVEEEAEPVQRPSRRELHRAARPAPALAVRATRRARVVAARSVEEPARPVRRRVRPSRVEEAAYVSRPEPAVSYRRAPRRFASMRRPTAPGGLQVSSVQTYYTPDGRRVVVNVPPRADLVR